MDEGVADGAGQGPPSCAAPVPGTCVGVNDDAVLGQLGVPTFENLEGEREQARARSPLDSGGGLHQGTFPARSVKVPVGPSLPMSAIARTASVPSVTVWVPWWPLRSVAV